MTLKKRSIDIDGEKHEITYSLFEETTDFDVLTKIDYSNLESEISNIPTLMTKAGLMRAMVQNSYSRDKMKFEIFEAESKRSIRDSLAKTRKLKGIAKPPTIEEVDVEFKLMPEYRLKFTTLLKKQEDLEIVDSFYWGCKSKSDKLDSLANSNLRIGDMNDFLKEKGEKNVRKQLIK